MIWTRVCPQKHTSPLTPWPGSNQFSYCLSLPRDIISGVINFDARSHLGKNTVFWPSDEITSELPVWGPASSSSKNPRLKKCKKHLSLKAVYNLRGHWCAVLNSATRVGMEDGLKRWASPPVSSWQRDRWSELSSGLLTTGTWPVWRSHQESWPHAHGKDWWLMPTEATGGVNSVSLTVRSWVATYATLNPLAPFQLWI